MACWGGMHMHDAKILGMNACSQVGDWQGLVVMRWGVAMHA